MKRTLKPPQSMGRPQDHELVQIADDRAARLIQFSGWSDFSDSIALRHNLAVMFLEMREKRPHANLKLTPLGEQALDAVRKGFLWDLDTGAICLDCTREFWKDAVLYEFWPDEMMAVVADFATNPPDPSLFDLSAIFWSQQIENFRTLRPYLRELLFAFAKSAPPQLAHLVPKLAVQRMLHAG